MSKRTLPNNNNNNNSINLFPRNNLVVKHRRANNSNNNSNNGYLEANRNNPNKYENNLGFHLDNNRFRHHGDDWNTRLNDNVEYLKEQQKKVREAGLRLKKLGDELNNELKYGRKLQRVVQNGTPPPITRRTNNNNVLTRTGVPPRTGVRTNS